MSPPARTPAWRRGGAQPSPLVAVLLLFLALLGAAFGGSAGTAAKPGTGSASPAAQFQRGGAAHLRFNAVGGAERALASADRSAVWSPTPKLGADPGDAAPAAGLPHLPCPGRAALVRACGDSALHGELVLGYASRAPPVLA